MDRKRETVPLIHRAIPGHMLMDTVQVILQDRAALTLHRTVQPTRTDIMKVIQQVSRHLPEHLVTAGLPIATDTVQDIRRG